MNFFGTILISSALVAPVAAHSHTDQVLWEKPIYKTVTDNRALDSVNDGVTTTRRNAITRSVAKASPAIVGINVTEIKQERVWDPWQDMRNDPYFGQMLRQLYGNQSGGGVRQYNVESLGSGFIISSDGYILTNDHVAGRASKIIVTAVGGKEYDAKLVATDVVSDVALLKIEAENLPFITLGNSDDLAVGEWAIAMGNPFGLFKKNDKPTVTVGVVSNTGVNLGYENGKNFRNMIQTDAAISSGNSGGPLLNANGEAIGINATIFSTAQGNQGSGSIGLGFAIPINKVKTILDDFRSGKKIDHNIGNLGFNGQTMNEEFREMLGVNITEGCVITGIMRSSVALQAGLQQGDVITAVDGEKVKSYEELISIIKDKKVGDVIKISVARSEGIIIIPLRLPPAR